MLCKLFKNSIFC